MRTDEVKDYLTQATARVEKEDSHLLMVDVSERCIAARLAMYLREYFADYDVDAEYNRHGEDKKKLYDLVDKHDCSRDRGDEGQRVLPDVIVHRRGDDDSNLLIVEMKKSANQGDIARDRHRIKAFRAELGYEFGALVVCETKGHSAIFFEWYEEDSGGLPSDSR